MNAPAQLPSIYDVHRCNASVERVPTVLPQRKVLAATALKSVLELDTSPMIWRALPSRQHGQAARLHQSDCWHRQEAVCRRVRVHMLSALEQFYLILIKDKDLCSVVRASSDDVAVAGIAELGGCVLGLYEEACWAIHTEPEAASHRARDAAAVPAGLPARTVAAAIRPAAGRLCAGSVTTGWWAAAAVWTTADAPGVPAATAAGAAAVRLHTAVRLFSTRWGPLLEQKQCFHGDQKTLCHSA